MMDGHDNQTNNGYRSQAIIDFVKSHPECDKEEVVRHCFEKGIASRLTVRKIIKDLEKDGILNVIKEKDNSKSYKLTVNSENLLVIIPKDLEEIFAQFKVFLDTVKKIPLDENEIISMVENSIYSGKISNQRVDSYSINEIDLIKQSISLLPYIMVDIISDVITFSFIFTLHKKIDANDFPRLYLHYFKIINKMYLQILGLMPENVLLNKNISFEPPPIYKHYLASKKYGNFIKVGYLAYLCTFFGIDEVLYRLLDLLWIKNIDTVSFMYNEDLKDIFDDYEYRETSVLFAHQVMFCDKTKLKRYDGHDDYDNEMLNKLHEGLECFILMGKGLGNWMT